MVFLSPLAEGLGEFWQAHTKNRGPRAIAGIVEALDELVAHYEDKLDKEQKKQMQLCVRVMRRRISHVRSSLSSLSGSGSSSSNSSDSDSGDSVAELGGGGRRKNKAKKDPSARRDSQRALMRSAVAAALQDGYARSGSMAPNMASAVVASLSEDVGKEAAGKTQADAHALARKAHDERNTSAASPVGKEAPSGGSASKGKLALKGAMKKIKLGLKLKRAFTPSDSSKPGAKEAARLDAEAEISRAAAGEGAGAGAEERDDAADETNPLRARGGAESGRSAAASTSAKAESSSPRPAEAAAAPKSKKTPKPPLASAKSATSAALAHAERNNSDVGRDPQPSYGRTGDRASSSSSDRKVNERAGLNRGSFDLERNRKEKLHARAEQIAPADADAAMHDPQIRRPSLVQSQRRSFGDPRSELYERQRKTQSATALVEPKRNSMGDLADLGIDRAEDYAAAGRPPTGRVNVVSSDVAATAALNTRAAPAASHRRSSKERILAVVAGRRSSTADAENEEGDSITPLRSSVAHRPSQIIPEESSSRESLQSKRDTMDPVSAAARSSARGQSARGSVSRSSFKSMIPQMFGGARGNEILGSPRRLSATMLSGRAEEKVVWQRKEWQPPIFRRMATSRLLWDAVVGAMCIFTFVVLTLRVGFGCPANRTSEKALELVSDVVMVIDVLITARTTFIDKNSLEEVFEPKKIWAYYRQTPHLLPDVLSGIPALAWLGSPGMLSADSLRLAAHPGVLDCIHLVKLLRMTRFWRLGLVKNAVSGTVLNPSALRFTGLMFTSIAVLHIIACIYWYVCRRFWPIRRWRNSEWLPYLHGERTGEGWENGRVPSLEVIASAYAWAIYWAISNALADGPTPHNTLQSAFTAVVFIIGLAFQSFFIASASSLLANMDATRAERARHLEQIQQFLRSRNIPSRTLSKVVSYYQYLWLCGDGSGVERLMRDIPRTLKAEIDLYLKRRLIESVPFFRTCSVAEILTVVQSLRPRIMMPKDYIIRQGDAGDEMYFIVRGNANVVVSKVGQPDIVVVTLRQGQFFGESALMEGEIAVRNASVRSEGFSELMSLSRADFREMTIQFPHFKEFVQKLARERARAKREKEERENPGGSSKKRESSRNTRRSENRMGRLRRSISSIRTVNPNDPNLTSNASDSDAPTYDRGSGFRSGGRGVNRFSQGLRQASFSFAKRGSLSGAANAPATDTIDEKAPGPPAAADAPAGTTETLIDRLHTRGALSRGLSNCRQASTVTNASASSGKGDADTASLAISEDPSEGAADRPVPGADPSNPTIIEIAAARAPPKRGAKRSNSITADLITSGMDRLGLAGKSRRSTDATNGASGGLRRVPSMDRQDSVFEQVARSLETTPVEKLAVAQPAAVAQPSPRSSRSSRSGSVDGRTEDLSPVVEADASSTRRRSLEPDPLILVSADEAGNSGDEAGGAPGPSGVAVVDLEAASTGLR